MEGQRDKTSVVLGMRREGSVRRLLMKRMRGFLVGIGSVLLVALLPGSVQAAPGDQLWVARHSTTFAEGAHAVVTSPDSSKIFVAGWDDGNYVAIAYDASNGSQLWLATYDDDAANRATSIAIAPDGSKIFLTGTSTPISGAPAILTIALNTSNGDRLWAARYPGSSTPVCPCQVTASPDNSTVFVMANPDAGLRTGDSDYRTIAYNASTGSELWVASFRGNAAGPSNAVASTVSRDSSTLFVTGRTIDPNDQDPIGNDFGTVAYNALTGKEIWEAYYNTNDELNTPSAITASRDGSKVFVAGASGARFAGDYATVAYDAPSGRQLWVTRFSPGVWSFATAMSASPDSSKVFVSGVSGREYVTIAYDAATGNQLWEGRVDSGREGEDAATNNAENTVSPDGSTAFVTGPVGIGVDYGTAAFDASNGNQLWMNRYDGPTSDIDDPSAIAAIGSRVFVTGLSVSSTFANDFATVAYEAGSAPSPPPPPPPPPLEQCGDAAVIGVRGSGDNSNGLDWPGRHAREVASLLRSKWHLRLYDAFDSNPTDGVIGLRYQAVSATDPSYPTSVGLGVQSLRTDIAALRDPVSGCGSKLPILLVGFSQGAHVIQSALEQLDDAAIADPVWQSIAGVSLIASPRFSPTDPAARGTFVADYPFGGLLGKADIRGRFQPITRTWCVDNDAVCVADPASVIGTVIHTNHTHNHDYGCNQTRCGSDLPGYSILQDAAGLLAWAVNKRNHVPAPPSPTGGLYAYRQNATNTVRVTAAAVYARGAPTETFAWDFDSNGTVDDLTDIPWVRHNYGVAFFGRKQLVTTVAIRHADGTVTKKSICIRQVAVGTLIC